MSDTVSNCEVPSRPDYMSSLRLLSDHWKGSRLSMTASVVLATASAFLELLPVWAIYRLIDVLVHGTSHLTVFVFYGSIALSGVLFSALTFGMSTALSHRFAFKALYRVRLASARHMSKLPMGYFADRSSGEAKNLIIDEPERLELLVAHGIPDAVSAITTWIAVTVWLVTVDWRMAIASMVMTPIAFGSMAVAIGRSSHHALAYQWAGKHMTNVIVEYLAGMSVIKIFNRTDDPFAEAKLAVKNFASIETEMARDFLALGTAFYTLAGASIVVILPVGLWLLQTGQITFPTLLLFVVLGANYSRPLLKLFNQFHSLAHMSMGSAIIADILKQKQQHDTKLRVVFPNYDIAFHNVKFGYTDQRVLHDVSLTAKTGQVTALVGLSGSGKSTIASLIPRLWDVDGGSISIGGIDTKDIGLEQLMDTVAFVFQNTFLFSDTIAVNIRYGNQAASDADIVAAAKAAHAHEFIIALPRGYDSVLSEGGTSLSGGERQRLAIARAFLKDAPIVVLDEATAFSDPDNEAAIQAAIGALSVGKTLIIVAHRLHTIASADQILVVHKGKIVERGVHRTLIDQNEIYAGLWRDYTASKSLSLRTLTACTQRNCNEQR